LSAATESRIRLPAKVFLFLLMLRRFTPLLFMNLLFILKLKKIIIKKAIPQIVLWGIGKKELFSICGSKSWV